MAMYLLLLLLLQILVNSSSAQERVHLMPSGYVVRPFGDDHTEITCFSSSIIESLQWLVNSTHLEELNLTNVETEKSSATGTEVLILHDLTEEFNMTSIQCVATLQSRSVASSNIVTFVLQGDLQAVDCPMIRVTNPAAISLTWTAPFSLDITNVDPDITYCVDVVDSTSMSTLHSQCGLIDTGFNYSLCNEEATSGDYTFTITPVNVIGNGTSATVQYSQALTPPRVSEQQLMPLSSMDGVYTYQMTLSSLVCESELTFEDVDTGEETRLGDSDLIISNNTIMFTTAQLSTNRLYSVSVSASNPSGSALSNTRINTHSVVDTTIISTFNMGMTEFAIQTEYSAISSASGVLYAFMLMERNGIDFSKSTYLPLNMSESLDYRLLLHLSPGTYSVLAYDIESNGRLLTGVKYPASRSQLLIGGNLSTNKTSFHSECNVNTINGYILVFCNFSSSKFAGFQMIVQNTNIDKLLVNTTTDQLTPATVQVPDNGSYHITILYIDRHTGILGSTPYHYTLVISDEMITNLITSTFSSATFAGNISVWIGVGVGSSALLLILAVIVMITASVLCCHKSSKQRQVSSTRSDGHSVSPPSEPIYEEIGNSPGAFKYTQCPIYGLSPDVLMSEEV